ncbi:amino acid transporter, partial [Thalassiosira pseudonana CCMP1335]
ILGASLIFGGTAVGAGMLALPAETIDAGFVPTIFGLILCWMFTFVTSLVVLEASWLSTCRSGGFLSISRMALGRPGEILTAILFWFLLTAIIVAYTSEGGQLVSQGVKEVALIEIAPAIGSLIFATFFASLATVGTSRVDTINRVFVLGLVATFIGLVGTGLSMVTISNLLDHSDWKSMYPTVISIGILSFGAQNVVPTLLRYLDNDPMKARQAILFGSLMPLFLYTIWEAVFLGIVGTSVLEVGNKMEVMSVLGQTGGSIVGNFVEVFSICAIGSSMAGASVSLVDFFQDALEQGGDDRRTKVLVTALALLPPVVIAYAFPDVFLIALEKAGLLGGVSLYGVIPALSI